MGSVRIAVLAAVAAGAIASGAANAADYSPPPNPCQPQYPGAQVPPHCVPQCPPPNPYGPPPPPHCMTPPPPPAYVEEFGGWYIRGDIGMTNQAVAALDNALYANTTGLRIIDKNFEAGMLFGLGFGYKWNNWLRFDITGEYRGETGFHGMDIYTDGGPRFNNYTAKKSEWLYLANIYADLGTWGGVTPFVGAGIGFARVGIHSFRDAGIDGFGAPTLAYAESDYKWNIAYAFHAGLAYQVTNNFTIELAYRYVYLGDGQSGDIIAYDGTNNIRNPMIFRDIDSHDLKLGIRYQFASAVYQQPIQQQIFQPLMRRF
jgi:opacity protein-like surface antigen